MRDLLNELSFGLVSRFGRSCIFIGCCNKSLSPDFGFEISNRVNHHQTTTKTAENTEMNRGQYKQRPEKMIGQSRETMLQATTTTVCLLTTVVLMLLPRSATSFYSNVGAHSLVDRSRPRECTSIDVRNGCRSLEQIYGCTVIKGFLLIVLLPKIKNKYNNSVETCDYRKYQFTQLREITDYLIFYDVRGLTTIRDMFPSLTVIRGRTLFLNYALTVSRMPDLEYIEFKSLVAIQRGHVYIGSCPKLCNLNKVSWDRLTLSPGVNHIFPESNVICPPTNDCSGCDSGYCWSNFVCQKFENTNVANYAQGLHDCNSECLGGCFHRNTSNEACVVCRGLTDHGACVTECPQDKYMFKSFQRCYTRQECIYEVDSYIHDSSCVEECPYGFKPDDLVSECIPCRETDDCKKVCTPHVVHNGAFVITSLEEADLIKNCHILNGSLIIAIRSLINEHDLMHILENVREIRGHLKVIRSPNLTSLNFLQNIQKISGHPLESNLYAIIIYDNPNLKELWKTTHPETPTVVERGSLYIHLNNKLCNRVLREFQDAIEHDQKKDSVQTSDQEVLCDPAKLKLEIQVLSHKALKYTWLKAQTSKEIEVLYRPVLPGETFTEESELDSNVCSRINWQRRLVFRSELQDDGTHYSFEIGALQSNMQYACLLKTFSGTHERDARSLLQMVRTRPDKPTQPTLKVVKRTDSSLTIEFSPSDSHQLRETVDFYQLEVFERVDDQQQLDQRDFCKQPALLYQEATSARNEDYDDCCERQEEEAVDNLFIENMRSQFACSLDSPKDCVDPKIDSVSASPRKMDTPLKRLRLESNETSYTFHHLERFRLYTFQLKACSSEIGCGSYRLLSERTAYSPAGDKLEDLQACRISVDHEYHTHFSEPKHPNGQIVSYVIHFRNYLPGSDTFESHIMCVTRVQHAESRYRHVAQLNTSSFNEVAVRVHSLAGDVLSHWINVTECSADGINEVNVDVGSGHGRGINLFFLFFLVGAGGTVLWICYKRRYWRHLTEWGHYCCLPLHWRSVIMPAIDDREILIVDRFETVRFTNNAEDEINIRREKADIGDISIRREDIGKKVVVRR